MKSIPPQNPGDQSGVGALLIGGLAALLVSTCCLAPLALVTLGISGAWIGSLSAMAAYQPLFIGAALVALFFAGKRIWRPAVLCAPGEVCALPRVNRAYKLFFVAVCALLLIALIFPFMAHWFY